MHRLQLRILFPSLFVTNLAGFAGAKAFAIPRTIVTHYFRYQHVPNHGALENDSLQPNRLT